MTLKKILFALFIGFTTTAFAQGTTEIEAKDGLHYVTYNNIDFPITGTYYFKGLLPK